MDKQIEGSTEFLASLADVVSRDMPVFYNPVMKLNRDLSLLAIASMKSVKNLRLCFPMEASGVRVSRLLNEVIAKGLVSPYEIRVNDLDETAVQLIEKNIHANIGEFPIDKIQITQKEASLMLRELSGWHYIDIDPFGSPNQFLDSAVRRISRKGILAVTATDTSALAGTYPRVCRRKYWAEPSRTWAMHEMGLRILIRKVQLIGAQYEKSLTPVLSISRDHYYRVFFLCDNKQSEVQKILSQHKRVNADFDEQTYVVSASEDSAGPMWTGDLHDVKFVKELLKIAKKLGLDDACNLLEVIEKECELQALGFVDLHNISKITKIHGIRKEELLAKLGDKATVTHVSPRGIKTDLSISDIRAFLE